MLYCLTHLSLQWHFPPERNFGSADNQKVIIYSRQNNYRQLLTQNSTKIWPKKNNMNGSVKFTVRKATREVFMWLYLQIHCVWRCALWERKSRITARRHDSFFFFFFFLQDMEEPPALLPPFRCGYEWKERSNRKIRQSFKYPFIHSRLVNPTLSMISFKLWLCSCNNIHVKNIKISYKTVEIFFINKQHFPSFFQLCWTGFGSSGSDSDARFRSAQQLSGHADSCCVQIGWKQETDADTYSWSHRRHLHEPVRVDGADIPRCAAGRVRCRNHRSDMESGVHSRTKQWRASKRILFEMFWACLRWF